MPQYRKDCDWLWGTSYFICVNSIARCFKVSEFMTLEEFFLFLISKHKLYYTTCLHLTKAHISERKFECIMLALFLSCIKCC